MRRREFIRLLGGTAAAALSAFGVAQRQAQGQNRPRVGFIFSGSSASNEFIGFTEGLRELGYVEGQNIDVEYRFAENSVERLPNSQPTLRGST
jgi:putative tryptophan/tyrosine transport system substrate-binding protein